MNMQTHREREFERVELSKKAGQVISGGRAGLSLGLSCDRRQKRPSGRPRFVDKGAPNGCDCRANWDAEKNAGMVKFRIGGKVRQMSERVETMPSCAGATHFMPQELSAGNFAVL